MKNLKHSRTLNFHFKPFFLTAALIAAFSSTGQAATILPGETVEGNINAAGVSNLWTFTANSGDAIVVRVGEELNTTFTPKIQLLSPASVSLGTAASAVAAEIAVSATNSGTFTVIVSDNSGTLTNLYRLSLAKTGSAITVDPGDQGGPMTNGVMQTGTILTGDLDTWTFNATNGDSIIVRMGEVTDTNTFWPWVRLYGPNGVLLGSGYDSAVGEVTTRATNNGTFLVVVGDGNGSLSGSGDYRLTLAKTGDPVVVSPGDQGGPMTNGVMHLGTINTGDLDLWTFSATNGDSIIVRMGEITDTNTFWPWVRLYGPNGVLLGSGYDSTVGEVTARATNSGTFLVVVGDGNGSLSGSGDYRLTLAKTGDPVVISAGDDGGPMTNGVMHLGTINTGDLDLWTFSATNGDSIIVRMGEVTDTNTFWPWVRLYGPNGVLLGSGYNSTVGEVTATATNSGTFLVVVGDGNGSLSGSGNYRLTLAKTGDPVVVSPGDQGGPMTNGVMHLGTVLTGDLDLWTFTANVGDAIIVRTGELNDTNTFTPWVRLYGPNGKLLDSGFGASVGEVTATATNSGTFLVVVGDGNGALSGSGDYRLTLAKTGDPVVISAGDDGGPMTNGVMHLGTVLTGDLDLWTFTANPGDALVLRVGMVTATNSFTPWIRLYTPNGVLQGSGFGSIAGEVAVNATNSGTYIVVVGDGNGAFSGSGDYRLTLVKTGDPITISAGDDGGPLTNGLMNTGTIVSGDLDPWTLTANAGDRIIVRIGEITDTSGNFTPWIRVYGPNGVLQGSGFGAMAGEVNFQTTNSGTFIVIAADGNGSLSGTGDYRLTLAKTGSPFFTSAGDEGGLLNSGVNPVGVITVGDIDMFTFTQCKGEGINLRLDELVDTSGNFTPWLRLYGPNGTQLGSVSGATTAQLNLLSPTNGTFTVLISDGNGALSGAGTYQLTSNGLSFEPRMCTPVISSANLFLTGVGGVSNAVYVLYQTTNVSTPQALWTPITTNAFDIFGVLSKTNLYDPSVPQQFFRYRMP